MHKYMLVGLLAVSSSSVMTMQLAVKKSNLTPGDTVGRRRSDPRSVAICVVQQQVFAPVSKPLPIVRMPVQGCVDFSPPMKVVNFNSEYSSNFSPSRFSPREFSPSGYYISEYNGLGDQALSPEVGDEQR